MFIWDKGRIATIRMTYMKTSIKLPPACRLSTEIYWREDTANNFSLRFFENGGILELKIGENIPIKREYRLNSEKLTISIAERVLRQKVKDYIGIYRASLVATPEELEILAAKEIYYNLLDLP